MSYYYYTELCKIDPSLKIRNDLDFSSISSLLHIMENKVLDVSFLERMSNDFDWNYQEVLVTQVITDLHVCHLFWFENHYVCYLNRSSPLSSNKSSNSTFASIVKARKRSSSAHQSRQFSKHVHHSLTNSITPLLLLTS